MKMVEAGKTKSGKTVHKFLVSASEYYSMDEGYGGLCVFCGADVDMCEPDARMRECEECGQRGGYGANELLMRGLISFEGDE